MQQQRNSVTLLVLLPFLVGFKIEEKTIKEPEQQMVTRQAEVKCWLG